MAQSAKAHVPGFDLSAERSRMQKKDN
jgi:hypothetical protein